MSSVCNLLSELMDMRTVNTLSYFWGDRPTKHQNTQSPFANKLHASQLGAKLHVCIWIQWLQGWPMQRPRGRPMQWPQGWLLPNVFVSIMFGWRSHTAIAQGLLPFVKSVNIPSIFERTKQATLPSISVTDSVYFWCHLNAFTLSPLAEYQIWSQLNAFLLLTKSLYSSKNLSINSDLRAFFSFPTKLWSSINLVIRCSTAILQPRFLFKQACSVIVYSWIRGQQMTHQLVVMDKFFPPH